MPEVTDKFLKDHDIRVIDTNKRAIKRNRVVDLFTLNNDYNIMQSTQQRMETERLFTVEITESELDRIASFEANVFNNMKQQGHYNMFEMIMQQKEEEQTLRNKYAAVKKLYEQYSMVLSLAKSNNI